MPTYEIPCETCGTRVSTKRKNTKYCGVCRLYRDLIYLDRSKATCWGCDAKFLRASRNDRVCADCLPVSSHQGHCAVCGKSDRQMVVDGVAVCRHCIHDEAKRSVIIKALRQRQIRQTEESHEHAV